MRRSFFSVSIPSVISFFFHLSEIRKDSRGKRFFFFQDFLCILCSSLFTDGGRGRARGRRDAAYPTKKRATGRLSQGVGRFGGARGGCREFRETLPPPLPLTKHRRRKKRTSAPDSRKTADPTKNQHGSTPNNHRVQIICLFLFIRKTGGGTRKGEKREKVSSFSSLSSLSSLSLRPQQPLSSPLSRSKLFPLSLSLCFSLSLWLPLSQG